MCELTVKQAAQFCGGTVQPEHEEIVFTGAGFDSRQVAPGQLFVALQGQRDGHDYASGAVARGAAAVLAQRPLPGLPVLLVDDTRLALGDIARGWRQQVDPTVVAITGSVGKTTTKEMTAAVVSQAYVTTKTQKNFNNDIGLPVTMLSMDKGCQAAVVEMGMNHFGELSYLTSIAQPDIAVITNIGTMHIEHLGSRQGILKAKLEILEGLRPGGTVIFNGDEPLLRQAPVEQTPLFFGVDSPCDLMAKDIVSQEGQISFRAVGMGCDFGVTIPAEGRHHVYDALAAIAVGLTLQVPPQAIAHALSRFENTGDRQHIYEQKGYTIIADCYNAGPESMEAALSVLASRKTLGRRIAVLGDMLELGLIAQAAHYRLGQQTAEAADMVFAYGPNSKRVVAGAVDAGMPAEWARCYDSHALLAADLRRNATPGDILLFKGSHGMHMERVLEHFLAEQT